MRLCVGEVNVRIFKNMEGASMSTNPRTVEEVCKDYRGRRAGMLKALTSGKLLLQCSLSG